MSQQMEFVLYRIRHQLPLALLLLVALVSMAWAQTGRNSDEVLLDETEYRSELEEVVVIGQQPEWRKPSKPEEWRPDKFELPKSSSSQRLDWLPEYTKDERDNYQGVRDRTGEKPEFKIFNWRF
ncbi:MAG: hypothetical protein WCY88_13020 [Spongiibacteraceae bacterium]